MLKKTSFVLSLLLAIISNAAAQQAAKPQLPATEAGERVAAYIKAFNSGDEQVMRAFFASNVSEASLKRRSIDERIQIYKEMRSSMEKLELRRVTEAAPNSITVIFQTSKGEWFEFGFEFENEAPHKLLGLRIEDTEAPTDNKPTANAPVVPAKLTEAEFTSTLEKHLGELVKADEFSGTVLIAKNGKPVFQKAYGLASKEYNAPNRPDTKFNLGSINKIFTQVAIGQLVEQGKISYDDLMSKYLEDYPNREAAGKVTIRQLLSMSSGIGDFFGDKFDATPKNRLRNLKDFVPMFANEPLLFEPGTKQQYSNGGYVLLGAIIEKVAGQSYYDYVREHIFKPAGMENTDYYEADVPVQNMASGYTREQGVDGARRNNIYTRPARGSSAGGGYSTAEDLLRFANALQSGKLHKANFSKTQSGDGDLGIAGGAPGINALLESDTSSGYTVIVMSNYDPPTATSLGKQIRQWLARIK